MDNSIDTLKKRLLSGSVWAFIGKLLTNLLNLIINVLLVRLLIPEAVGTYFLVLSLVTVSAMIAQLGLNYTLVRLIAESMAIYKPGRALKTIYLSLVYGGIGSLVVASLLLLGIGKWLAEYLFQSTMMVNVVGLTALWAILTTLQSLISEIFRGFHAIQLATLFGELLKSVLLTLMLLSVWVLYDESNLGEVTLLSVIATLATVLIAAQFLWNKLKELQGEDKNGLTTKELLSITWPMWFTNLTLFILIQSDIWILGIFLSPEQVAIYGAASRLVVLVSMPLMIVNAVLPPLIAELYAQNKKQELEQLLRLSATMTSIPTFIVLGIYVLFSDPLLGFIYGDYYRQGTMVLIFLSIGQFVNVWAGSCGLTLMMTGYQTTMMLISVLCGLITVVGSIWAVQPYGSVGVAAIAGAGMALQNFLMLILVKNKLNIWTHTHLMTSLYRLIIKKS